MAQEKDHIMTLTEYVDRHGGAETLKVVARQSGISIITVRNVYNGMQLRLYEVAKAISQATNFYVSIPELCEHQPSKRILTQFFYMRKQKPGRQDNLKKQRKKIK